MKTAIALLLLIALPGMGMADALHDNAIVFGPSYASGPPAGFPWDPVVYVGAPLSIFGIVNNVGALFTDLLPPGSYEMTCVFEGATCDQWGAWDDFVCTGGIYGSFDGGTMSIYLDTTPDADFMSPASFRNGELVLQAQTQTTFATDDDPNVGCPMVADRPDVQTWFTFSGGSWFHRVSSGGIGMTGVGEGEVHDRYPYNVPVQLRVMGYIFPIDDGTMDIFGPVATKPTTWGHVKSLFR
jgi:hypothetical protein